MDRIRYDVTVRTVNGIKKLEVSGFEVDWKSWLTEPERDGLAREGESVAGLRFGVDKRDDGWYVTELSSGLMMGHGRTREDACQRIKPYLLDEIGRWAIVKKLEKFKVDLNGVLANE